MVFPQEIEINQFIKDLIITRILYANCIFPTKSFVNVYGPLQKYNHCDATHTSCLTNIETLAYMTTLQFLEKKCTHLQGHYILLI